MARPLDAVKRRYRGDPARYGVGATGAARPVAAATALLRAGPAAAVELPEFGHALRRDPLRVGAIHTTTPTPPP